MSNRASENSHDAKKTANELHEERVQMNADHCAQIDDSPVFAPSPVLPQTKENAVTSKKRLSTTLKTSNREFFSHTKTPSLAKSDNRSLPSSTEVKAGGIKKANLVKSKGSIPSSSPPLSVGSGKRKLEMLNPKHLNSGNSVNSSISRMVCLSGGGSTSSSKVRHSAVAFGLVPFSAPPPPRPPTDYKAMNPDFTLYGMTVSQQLERMKQEYNALEVATQNSSLVDFSTSLYFEHLNRYSNVGANEDTIFPPREVGGRIEGSQSTSAVPTAGYIPRFPAEEEEQGYHYADDENRPASPLPCFYINANYMRVGLPENQVIVASQAPIPPGFPSFYGTLLRYRISLIIMLSKEKEGNTFKADPYWPPKTASFENPLAVSSYRLWYNHEGEEKPFEINPTLSIIYRHFFIQEEKDYQFNMDLLKKKKSAKIQNSKVEADKGKVDSSISLKLRRPHKVELIQYVGWPDHGVPSSSAAFCSLLSRMDDYFYGTLEGNTIPLSTRTRSPDYHPEVASPLFQEKAEDTLPRVSAPALPPLLIHCSAGLGRTATLIGSYAAIYRLRQGTFTDCSMKEVATQMRQCRFGSIQRVEQYMFMYQVLMTYLGIDVTALAKEIAKRSRAALTLLPRRY